jgi:hypothetical protein
VLGTIPGAVERGDWFASGAEAEVYRVVNHPDFLVKLYKHEPSPLKLRILDRIIAAGSRRSADCVAWPRAVVVIDGQTGVLVPFVKDARPVHQLYDLKDARQYFSPVNWRLFITAAENLARSVAEVHQAGFAAVDISETNVLVGRSLLTTLIDSDSFVPLNAGAEGIATLATALWLPPELVGRVDRVPRTVDHDNFSLARMIFLLLFQNSEPLITPPGMDPETAGGKVFGFSRRRPVRMPHPGELTLDALSYDITEMFEEAFQPDRSRPRPTAAAWAAALGTMAGELDLCSKVPAHVHLRHRRCPWCEMGQADPFTLFPSPVISPTAFTPTPFTPPPFTPPPVTPPPRPVTPPPSSLASRSSWLARHPVLVVAVAVVGVVAIWLSQRSPTTVGPVPAPPIYAPHVLPPPVYTPPTPPPYSPPAPPRASPEPPPQAYTPPPAPPYVPPPSPAWRYGQTSLCGKTIPYRVNTAQTSSGLVGIWHGYWSVSIRGRTVNICAAFIVQNVAADGSADIIYSYAGAGQAQDEFRQQALAYGDSLEFTERQGGHYRFVLDGGVLNSYFAAGNGQQLSTTFYRQ